MQRSVQTKAQEGTTETSEKTHKTEKLEALSMLQKLIIMHGRWNGLI